MSDLTITAEDVYVGDIGAVGTDGLVEVAIYLDVTPTDAAALEDLLVLAPHGNGRRVGITLTVDP